MREYLILPPLEHTHPNIWKVDYAFGYYPVTGQYKVVCLSGIETHDPAARSSSYKLEVEVYALGSCTWRNIGQFTYRLRGKSGVPVNGKIYWLVNAEEIYECPDSIWSFDFETELTEHVSLPPKFSEDPLLRNFEGHEHRPIAATAADEHVAVEVLSGTFNLVAAADLRPFRQDLRRFVVVLITRNLRIDGKEREAEREGKPMDGSRSSGQPNIRRRRRQSEKLGNTQPVAEEETMDYHGSSISDLPLNIVVDILSRLPTKTIIHCRCVCWTFHNIISDKYFANLHLLRSPGCLVIHHFNVDGFTSAYTVNELKEKPYRNSLQRNQLMKFDLKEKFPNAKLHLVCSANGFLCLRESDTHAVCICNPVMREYVIPPPPEHTHWNIWKVDYAFGYCPVTGQYKVVCLSGVEPHEPATRSSSYKLEVEVYALGTRTWRNIGQFTHRLPGRSGVPVNGKIYWLVNAEGLRECPDSIWSFDFETELTEHVSLPL
ncbi:hypothetical protein RJ639_019931 [Escallonia herrerae]|uniref:F-box domain-containing protein n=1 Tax=Escallonia herrerae TaxID=1293975 RepID=A0AA89AJW9_9ASTE|nr:hypothetical protein RJ639_019931 [Escallonia herrerae]